MFSSSCFFPTLEAKSNDDFFSREMMMDRVLDILDSAEKIISLKTILFLSQLTPIGPNGVQGLVNEGPVSFHHVWNNSDQSFTDLFQTTMGGGSPLLSENNNSYEQDDHFKNHYYLPPTNKRQCFGFTTAKDDGSSCCIKMPAAASSSVETKEST
jgi:hypothetical protein